MVRQIQRNSEKIEHIYYFRAFADWKPAQKSRHEQYVAALQSVGVVPILGHFKEKDRSCNGCGARWKDHEEKETDDNIALFLLSEAYRDSYDRAYIVSRDSDLKPAVEMIRKQFPKKEVFIISPPNLGHSNDLIAVATGKRKIKEQQIAQCLFPEVIRDGKGDEIARRPIEYNPPILGTIAFDRPSHAPHLLGGNVTSFLVLASVAWSMEVAGPARIVDGDTLEIEHQAIRIHGIDAAESGQRCQLPKVRGIAPRP